MIDFKTLSVLFIQDLDECIEFIWIEQFPFCYDLRKIIARECFPLFYFSCNVSKFSDACHNKSPGNISFLRNILCAISCIMKYNWFLRLMDLPTALITAFFFFRRSFIRYRTRSGDMT